MRKMKFKNRFPLLLAALVLLTVPAQALYLSLNAGAENNEVGVGGGKVYDQRGIGSGQELVVGALLQYIYAGPNGAIDPPDASGAVTGDDQLIANKAVGSDSVYGVFSGQVGKFYHNVTYNYGTGAAKVYVRAWNAATIGAATHYGNSALLDPATGATPPSMPPEVGIASFATGLAKPATAQNNPPVLQAIGPKNVVVGNSISFTVSATDADGDTLTYSASGLPTGATFNTATRIFSWTPTSPGTFYVTFSVSDNKGGSDSQVVQIVAISDTFNKPPVADNQSVTTDEGRPIAITLSASDQDGDQLTYEVVTVPAHGSLSGTAPNLTYTPAPNYYGSDSFTFKANDGQVDSNVATVSITVNPVNDPPVLAALDDRVIKVGENLRVMLSASDVEGGPLTYSVSPQPSGSSLVANQFDWTPTLDQAGEHELKFTVSDNAGGSATATLKVKVTGAISYVEVSTNTNSPFVLPEEELLVTIRYYDEFNQEIPEKKISFTWKAPVAAGVYSLLTGRSLPKNVQGLTEVEVRAGSLAKLELVGLPATVTAGATLELKARGVDAWDNEISTLAVNWSAVGAKVQGTTLTELTKAGPVSVTAVSGARSVTGNIQVLAAAPVEIKVLPAKVTLSQGESQTFVAKVYDAYGNERKEPLAFNSPFGNTATIVANVSPGIYYLTVSSGALVGTAEIRVVSLYDGFRAVVEGGFIKLYAKNVAGVEQLISGYDSISYKITGQEYGNSVSPDGRFTAGSKEGKYLLTVAIRHGDKTVEKEAEIHVNKGAPQIVVKYRNAELKTGMTIIGKPEFTVNLSDGNGIKSVRAYINDREITGFSPLRSLAANASSFTTSLSIDNRLEPGTYTLVIEAEDELGTKGVTTVSGLKVYDLLEVQGRPLNYPNPFSSNTGTTINYKLSKDADVKLMIYDLAGRLVYSEAFTSGSNGGRAGENEVTWTGKSFAGQRLANGVYPFYLTSGGKVIGTGEMTIFE